MIVLVFILTRISKDDWESTVPLVKEPEEVESIWNILNCVWLSAASLMVIFCLLVFQSVEIILIMTGTRLRHSPEVSA